MKAHTTAFRPLAAAAAAFALAAHAAHGQTSPPTQTVTITGRALPGAPVGGFGDEPLARTPMQVGSFENAQLQDAGTTSLGGLTRLDAAVGDAYNADGYWSQLAVRGYVLDNRFNYRRDGLPINAETAIALDNKDRIDLLKGASGIQAGTSAPGGLVDLVVKRPDRTLHQASLGWRERGTRAAAADLSGRFGPGHAFGLRLNAAYEHLDPIVRDTRGHRYLLALAGDWRLDADTLVEAEVESSFQRQPSVVGFSMFGDQVPAARDVDPRRNLNHQPWREPVEFFGDTASLRVGTRVAGDWRVTLHAMTQRLKTNDRTAFPYGLYDPGDFSCNPCDRFAGDGSFTYWQYVSDDEHRRSDALDLSLAGRVVLGATEHRLHAGVLSSRYRARLQDQVFDIAGTGRIDGSLDTLPSAGFTDANTDRTERSTEFSLRDTVTLAPGWQLWAGLRHTRLDRASERTSPDSDGALRATRYRQSFTTPWASIAHQWTPRTLVYASWGRGVETDVAPNRARYTNAGQPLPALKSRQVEVGVKHAGDAFDATLALFDIDRPLAADLGACDADDSCTRAIDGSQRHRGIEGQLAWRADPWQATLAAMLLDAERQGSRTAAANGTRPVNVPRASLRAMVQRRVAALPGLDVWAALHAESDRVVLPYDTRVRIPGWARTDLGARWRTQLGSAGVTWRIGVDNVFDRRAWKESPYQFGHVYLYPLAPRTWRLSAQFEH
jgi:iron complex outermembrane receptor protein